MVFTGFLEYIFFFPFFINALGLVHLCIICDAHIIIGYLYALDLGVWSPKSTRTSLRGEFNNRTGNGIYMVRSAYERESVHGLGSCW